MSAQLILYAFGIKRLASSKGKGMVTASPYGHSHSSNHLHSHDFPKPSLKTESRHKQFCSTLLTLCIRLHHQSYLLTTKGQHFKSQQVTTQEGQSTCEEGEDVVQGEGAAEGGNRPGAQPLGCFCFCGCHACSVHVLWAPAGRCHRSPRAQVVHRLQPRVGAEFKLLTWLWHTRRVVRLHHLRKCPQDIFQDQKLKFEPVCHSMLYRTGMSRTDRARYLQRASGLPAEGGVIKPALQRGTH